MQKPFMMSSCENELSPPLMHDPALPENRRKVWACHAFAVGLHPAPMHHRQAGSCVRDASVFLRACMISLRGRGRWDDLFKVGGAKARLDQASVVIIYGDGEREARGCEEEGEGEGGGQRV